MAENKLTNEEIVKTFTIHFGSSITGVESKDVVQNTHFDDIGKRLMVEGKVKLLLTRLSSISDEHAIQFAKLNLYTGGSSEEAFVKVGKDIIDRAMNHSKFPLDRPMCFAYDCYQYLIQQGYAVPIFFGVDHWANGKTAIELGLAMEQIK